jgi:hypothetical protein
MGDNQQGRGLMRIATYNVEWFNSLFDDDNSALADGRWSARWNVTRADQLDALGIVFTAIDADAVMVIEAPDTNGRTRSTVKSLEAFAARYDLRVRKAVMGFTNETQQEIALLYDPDVMEAVHDPIGEPTGKKGNKDAPRFDGVFRIDIDVDAKPDLITFSKPPLELIVTPKNGPAFRMIGVHAKSKAPHGARDQAEATRIGIDNRRKQLAQCIWLRQRVAAHLAAGDPLVVLGDFNDGPGLDGFEKLFGRSGVEIVLGMDQPPELRLTDPHARWVLGQRAPAMPATARFYLQDQKCWLSAMLDYIMVSPDLLQNTPVWRIWHPFDDAGCYKVLELREALLAASDHFPVTLDLTF